MNKFCLCIGLLFWMVACQSDKNMQAPIGQGVDMDQVLINRNGKLLPDVCQLVPSDQIANILNVDPRGLEITDSSDPGPDGVSKACFFKWPDDHIPNAGILLQAMRNPLAEEFPDYIIQFIISKKEKGEQGVAQQSILFTPWAGYGDDGAYSHDAGKYYWRLSDQLIFSIAFNTTHNASEQLDIANQLARAMTERYIQGR